MPKRPSNLPHFIGRDYWADLVDAAGEERDQEYLGVRDQAIIALGLASGLRVAELVALDLADVDIQERKVRVRHGKGDRERYVYVSRDTVDLLRAWLKLRPEPSTGEGKPLFVSRLMKRLSDRMVRVLVRNAGEKAGLGHVHPHMLRHSSAVAVLKKTGNLRKVQKHMGHARVTTTEIYTQVVDAELQRDLEDL